MELSAGQVHELGPIAEKHGLDLILCFGSAATGTLHPKSDLDIAVRYRRPPEPGWLFGELLYDLQTLFPEAEVDLSSLNTADPFFLKKILESARLLYGHPRDLAELEILAFKRYVDHRKYLHMEADYVRRKLAERGL